MCVIKKNLYKAGMKDQNSYVLLNISFVFLLPALYNAQAILTQSVTYNNCISMELIIILMTYFATYHILRGKHNIRKERVCRQAIIENKTVKRNKVYLHINCLVN